MSPRWGLSLLAAALLAGCGSRAYVKPGLLEQPPRRVAVLPFVITYQYDRPAGEGVPPSHAVGRDVFRKTFYHALTPYGYQDVKLRDVDARLTQRWGPLDQGAWQQAGTQELGQVLEADALVYGEISRLVHFSTPLYTETSLSASLRMVDAASGEVLWRKRVKAAERGGALVKKGQVVDFIKDQARSFHADVKFLRVSDAAMRQVFKKFPDPPAQIDVTTIDSAPGAARAGARLAVLPLDVKRPGWQNGAASLRTSLTASLQEGAFDIIEIGRVDAALKAFGWEEGQPVPSDLPVADLARALDADVVLRGTVTNWGRTYLAVQSWVKAELQLELLDPESGEVIWMDTRKNTRQAGILKGPTGYKSIVTAPITGLKTSNLERIGQHLTRAMVEDLSRSPAVRAYLEERRPAGVVVSTVPPVDDATPPGQEASPL